MPDIDLSQFNKVYLSNVKESLFLDRKESLFSSPTKRIFNKIIGGLIWTRFMSRFKKGTRFVTTGVDYSADLTYVGQECYDHLFNYWSFVK